MNYTIALLLITILQLQAKAQRVRFDLYSAMDGQMELSDGVFTNFWGYGFVGEEMTMPAPKLMVQTGDTVDVVMFNVSNESHTIHLHGLDVDQVNDGVPQTSFYVITGDSATYSFVAKYPGTYLYHCHVTTTQHLTMGMYGMLVVKEPGGVLYANGPAYQQERDFLFSDLEVRVNDDPMSSFPLLIPGALGTPAMRRCPPPLAERAMIPSGKSGSLCSPVLFWWPQRSALPCR